jgi:integrase
MAEQYLAALANNTYITDPTVLCDAFRRLGGMSFIRIGTTKDKEGFTRCFAYYADVFAAQWAISDKQLKSKYIGYSHVIKTMLMDKKNPIKYNFQYILSETPNNDEFLEIVETAFFKLWIARMKPKMISLEGLSNIAARIGDVRLSRYLAAMPETETYLKELAERFTAKRELITYRKMHCYIFGYDSRAGFPNCDERFDKLFRHTVDTEFSIQYHKFPAENRMQINVSNDAWILYAQHGLNLHFNCIDFTQITTPSMCSEVKYYMKHRFSGAIRINDRTFSILVVAINLLCELGPDIRYFYDIDDADARILFQTLELQGRKPSYIRGAFYALDAVMGYLTGSDRDQLIRAPRPHDNPFGKFRFVNAEQYTQNTEAIPQFVLSELKSHINELSDTDQLVFEIFTATGLRANEAAMLEENCIESTRFVGYAALRYKQHKTLPARRKGGRNDYRSVYISEDLAAKISEQIKQTVNLRRESGMPYIFLTRYQNRRINIYNVWYFADKINALIKRHGIQGESGELWHFTTRQYRKTLAAEMIENGATVEDLAAQFGHMDKSTAAKYYAEVRNRRLAEMNSEFFRKKFKMLISREQLAQYNEEERRLLYVDFRLGLRRTELGFCVNKLSNSGCERSNRFHSCVNCNHLCTGRQYLAYWKELLTVQEQIVAHLLEIYRQECIVNFDGFPEYRQELTLLEAYRNAVGMIEESEVQP